MTAPSNPPNSSSPGPPEASSPSPRRPADGPAILVVDDRPENLRAVEAALEPLGHRLVLAPSGEEALRLLLRDDVAAIVLDVQMPGLDGFEVARAVKARERTRDIPIVFVTAIDRDASRRRLGFDVGGVDYIFKPVDPELLRSKVSVFVKLQLRERELRRQREELARRTEDLARSNADLEQFAYIASHDLQEPLRVVGGYMELLVARLGDHLGDEERDWVARAHRSLDHMTALLDDLLVYARAAGPPAEPVPVDLDEAVAEALEAVRVTVDGAGAEVQVDSPLPAVMGHRRDLARLVQNLVANAVRHTRDHPAHVTISADDTATGVVLSVADDGPGIPEADRARAFGMFERLGDQPYPGSGMGLAICRRIVDRIGGRIWMQDAPGGGLDVRVLLRSAPAPAG